MNVSSMRLAHAAGTLFLWPMAYAVAAGSSAFVLRHLSWVPALDVNRVPAPDTFKMVFWSAGALVAIWILYGIAILVRRARTGAGRGFETIAEVNRRLRFLVALPFIPALTYPGVERDSPKETLFLTAIVALVAGVGAYAWLAPPRVEGADPRSGPEAPRPVRDGLSWAGAGAALAVIALWVGYGAFFSWLSITNHHALNTRTADLGYYDNIFFQSIHGHPLGCSFIKAGYHGSAHFDPLLVVLSPLYLLYPRAEGLLVLQSVWLGAGVVPAYLIARDKLRSRLAGVALAAMYAMHPALHGANMYEFHSLTLLTPILLWLLYFLQIEAYERYAVALVVALFCREDVALLLCFVGAYAVLTRRPRRVRAGWLTILASLAYFAVVKRFFMTSTDLLMSGKDAYSFAYYYDALIPNHNGVAGLLASLVTNPVFVVTTMLREAKILYVVTLFFPLVFLPFVARPGRLMLVYGLLFALLASKDTVYSVHYQYSANLLPVAFALAPAALAQIEEGPVARALGLDGRRLSRSLLAAAFAASVLVSWKFGGVVDNRTFKGGPADVARSLTDRDRETYAWVRAQADSIPAGASVGVTDHLGAHTSNRMTAFSYPQRHDVDYLFIDEAELQATELDTHTRNLRSGMFELVARRDRLALYKRTSKPPAPGDAAAP
jgi:uncharacterized membrane protein